MRRALEQLKELGVSGIILDLRNNGGGLLKDAIQIAGLFIKGGPVVQVKLSGGKSREYDDPDSGIVYSGPLVILVNEFSASASEIVAAALQDYSRAVIVGDHTFGKGTVQQVVDLDSLLIFDDMKPLGSVKITVQKFYRINGDSTQQKGVIGDISLPDPYNGMEIGENSMDYPLEWDTTEVLKYSKWVPEYDIEVMREKSRDRVSKNEIFNMIVSNAMLLSNQINSPRSLRLLRFMEEQKNIKEIGERLNKILESTNFLNVSIPASEKSESDYNERKDKLESYSKLLSKDIYADEAVNILDDINNSVVVSTGVP
jgi:carboxyl-terminal processing protease